MEKISVHAVRKFFPGSVHMEPAMKWFIDLIHDDSYEPDDDHFNTEGDIPELLKLMNEHALDVHAQNKPQRERFPTELEKVIAVGYLLNEFDNYNVMQPEHCEVLSGYFGKVAREYPKLMETFMIA